MGSTITKHFELRLLQNNVDHRWQTQEGRGVARGGCSGGSSTPFVGRTNTTIDGIDKQQNRKHARIIIKLYS